MRLQASFVTFVMALASMKSHAQELEPRFYNNIPLGMHFLAVGYARSEGDVLFDPSIALENARVTVDGPLVGYAQALKLGRQSGKFDAGIGNVCLDGSAEFDGEPASRYVCGWTDARLRLTVNLLGAPALPMAEFPKYRQDFVVGTSVTVSIPVGDYDPDRLVNIGTNRWATKFEIGASKAWKRWLFEAAVSTTVFGDNNDFFGGRRREQDPILALQAHIVRGFDSGIWLALDSTWYRGGKTETDGIGNANLQSNTRFGLTLSVPIKRQQSLKLSASTGISTRTGSDFDTAAIVWQYRWGARLRATADRLLEES